jgi:hypothetical protein
MLAEIINYKKNIIQAIKNALYKLVRNNPKKFSNLDPNNGPGTLHYLKESMKDHFFKTCHC